MRWTENHGKNLHNLHSSPKINKMIKITKDGIDRTCSTPVESKIKRLLHVSRMGSRWLKTCKRIYNEIQKILETQLA